MSLPSRMRSLIESHEVLHARLFLVTRDVCAPAAELFRRHGPRLLRLPQVEGGALEVALEERAGDLCCKQPLLQSPHAGIACSGGPEIGKRQRGLLETAAVQRLIEAPREHFGHAQQPVTRLGAGGIRGRGRAVIQQRIVGDGLAEAPLVHGEACFLEQLVHLALHDRGVGDRRAGGGAGRRACGGGRCGGGRCGGACRCSAAVHEHPVGASRQGGGCRCGCDSQGLAGQAARRTLLRLRGRLPQRPEDRRWLRRGRDTQRGFVRHRLRDRPFEHRLRLTRVDRQRQYRKNLASLERGAEQFVRGAFSEYHHHDARQRCVCGVHRGADVGELARVDGQHLAAPGARQARERPLQRIDRAYAGLTAERLSQLEQKIVPGGNHRDIRRGLREGLRDRGGARGGLGAAGGGRCTGHGASLQQRKPTGCAGVDPRSVATATDAASRARRASRLQDMSPLRQRSASVHNNDRLRREAATRDLKIWKHCSLCTGHGTRARTVSTARQRPEAKRPREGWRAAQATAPVRCVSRRGFAIRHLSYALARAERPRAATPLARRARAVNNPRL